MYFGIFTLLTALTISVIAAWYSIVGLTAIFAAAFLPIILMGGSLEVGKVVTAVWLHQNWDRANKLMRTYLMIATFLLMFITSMGIFGFLSKAHVEQTAASDESVAKIEQYTNEITRQELIIVKSNERVEQLENSGAKNSSTLQGQIDKEQERIDSAYSRIQPAIDEQNQIIEGQIELYSTQLKQLDVEITRVQQYVNDGEFKKAQGIIGTNADGRWLNKTVIAYEKWKAKNEGKRQQLITKIEQITDSSSAVIAARKEITRLRQNTEDQINQAHALINKIRDRIGKQEVTNNDDLVDQQYARITQSNKLIEDLTEKKYALQGEYRKLEAEVGPIKYIAEFVYGEEADQSMLERAVRWVIIILVLVFDPLAICLILAGAQQLMWSRGARGAKGSDEHPLDVSPTFVSKPDPEEVISEEEPEPVFEFPDHPIDLQHDAHFDGVGEEEPEPTITEIEEEQHSIVDSIEQMQYLMVEPTSQPAPSEESVKQPPTKTKRDLHILEDERKEIIKEIQRSEVRSTNTLPPTKVASVDDVPGTGKPFQKPHK